MLTFIIIALVVVGGYFILTYNGMVRLKTRIEAAMDEIANQLKRQADLLPNLVNAAKGYLEQESDLYEKITQARKTVSRAQESQGAAEAIKAAGQLRNLVGSLNVVIESNPEGFKSAGTVQDLMRQLEDTADKIMYSRRTLIDLTADYNTKIVSFPSNIIANIFGFEKEEGMEVENPQEAVQVDQEDLKTPEVDL